LRKWDHIEGDRYLLTEIIGEHNPEPIVCSVFGCGRRLTIQEQLFGGKCIDHSKPEEKQTNATTSED
jgi:hypothetical protein